MDAVRERLSALAASPPPEGTDRVMAGGFFLGGGAVEGQDLRLSYHFNSAKNAQDYGVRGVLRDTGDWRMIRLTLTARDPWLGPIEMFFLALFLGFHVYFGETPAKGAVVILVAVMALYAIANLLYIPDVVTSRVSDLVASTVNGSVLHRRGWVVPE